VTDFKFSLLVGIPTFAILISTVIDRIHYHAIIARFDSLDERFNNVESRFDKLVARIEAKLG